MLKSFIYLITEFISKFSIFLIFPIVAKLLSEDDFGKFSFIMPAMQYFQIVFTFGLTVSLSALFFNNKLKKDELLFNVFLFWTIIWIILFLIFKVFFNDYLDKLYYSKVVEYLLVYLYSMSLVLILAQYYQLRKEAIKYSMLFVLPKIGILLMSIYYSYQDNFTLLNHLIYSYMIVGLIFGIISFIIFIPKFKFKFNISLHKDFLIIGYPIIINGIIAYLVVISGRSVIADISTLSDVAAFTAIQTVAQIITLFYAVLARVVGIENYKRVAENNLTTDYLNSVFRISSILLVLSILIVACMAYPILIFIDKKYYFDYLPYILLLLFGYYFQIFYAVLVDIVYANKKTLLITITITSVVIINVCLVYTLFPIFGILGAVVSQIITIILQSLLVIFIVKKYNVKYNYSFLNLSLPVLFVGILVIYKIKD
ncbi:lipopolysaccharide biosynthesis protein, partial [Aliarcobacter skirrowii]|uniref:lipopolysaccharide biosynthesis protein n=1 Tax=Aliarcobacter skirrowii TaxID=28200 RepID=UPI0029AFE6FA